MPAPAPTRRRGRGGFALGDSLIARTSSPTRRHPSSADHHHQQHSSPNNHLNTVDLRVTGWRDSRVNTEQDGGIATLSRWLERKAQTALEKDAAAAAAEGVNKRRHTARIRKSRVDGNVLTISVSAEDAAFFLSCNNYQFAGAIMGVTLLSRSAARLPRDAALPPRGAEKPKFSFDGAARNEFTKGKLFAILGRRYDSTTKVINLSNLASEPEMQEVGLERISDPKLFRIFTVLIEDAMKTPEARKDGVTGLQLSGNKFTSLALIRTFTITFPELENLDLSMNDVATLADLSPIRQFKNLRHLIITDNPIVISERNLTEVLTRWFPKLQLLNQVQITHAEKAQATETIAMPLAAPGVFKDTDGVGEKFLKAFFPGFDSDRRRTVSDYYDKDSVFTMAVNNHALVDQSNKSQLQKNEWAEWIRGSRNLIKINHLSAQINRTHTGVENIAKAFESYPPTTHPPLSDASKWIVEAMPIHGLPDPSGRAEAAAGGVNGLVITVHGELSEHPRTTRMKTRSFDRTFTLGPGGVSGVRVLNDMWLLRSYGGTGAFPSAGGEAQREMARPEMVVEVARLTGMNEAYSAMCLEQTGWKVDAAVESFRSVRANIPPEAFAP